MKRNLTKCESYLFSLKAAGNATDYLANEMLSLVITLKIFILNHNLDMSGGDSSGGPGSGGPGVGSSSSCMGGGGLHVNLDLNLNRHQHLVTTGACLLGGVDPKSSQDVIHKLTRLDQKRLSNFHFINTLENLKLHLVKCNRSRRCGDRSTTKRNSSYVAGCREENVNYI